MHKNLNKELLIDLPSGNVVHPSRLIHKDGTLMWKHALSDFAIPIDEAAEQHIVKTAQRLEELNSWVSQDLEPWNFLVPSLWYAPDVDGYAEGISVNFNHSIKDTNEVYNTLCNHILAHETLDLRDGYIHFKRC